MPTVGSMEFLNKKSNFVNAFVEKCALSCQMLLKRHFYCGLLSTLCNIPITRTFKGN